ncbi:MAG TPA: stage V sporulation protein AE [Verrucomicrobiae bacterium]|nr:stage V sporulation protein AE [Verrucomicrobiae bacterium]
MTAKKVILITDGDSVAAKTVEVVAQRVGGSCISASQGNPTEITGEKLLRLIKKAAKEPVLVMVDDKGEPGKGQGESVLEYLANSPEVEILGTVAVAANSYTYQGVEVDFSIDKDGRKVAGPVNKNGCPEPRGHKFLEGDTVEVLNKLDIPIIVGTGDTGKMQGNDDWHLGADITTRAVQEILARSDL